MDDDTFPKFNQNRHWKDTFQPKRKGLFSSPTILQRRWMLNFEGATPLRNQKWWFANQPVENGGWTSRESPSLQTTESSFWPERAGVIKLHAVAYLFWGDQPRHMVILRDFTQKWRIVWLGCDTGGSDLELGLGVIYFPTNLGAKEHQNLPNLRVVGVGDIMTHIVDGRNPAPVDMENIKIFHKVSYR